MRPAGGDADVADRVEVGFGVDDSAPVNDEIVLGGPRRRRRTERSGRSAGDRFSQAILGKVTEAALEDTDGFRGWELRLDAAERHQSSIAELRCRAVRPIDRHPATSGIHDPDQTGARARR